jgi:predicted DNA-binding transcriptional regulator AlpA
MSADWKADLIRLSEVQNLTGLCRFEVYSRPGFPKPQRRGLKVLGWSRVEVENWAAKNRK